MRECCLKWWVPYTEGPPRARRCVVRFRICRSAIWESLVMLEKVHGCELQGISTKKAGVCMPDNRELEIEIFLVRFWKARA